MVTHSNILAWRIPWAEEPWATVHRVAESDITEGTNSFTLRNSPRIKRDNTDKGVDSSRSITILNIYVLHSTSGSAGKESTCNVGDLDSISGLGISPGEGKGYSLQYSGLENSMDCIVHGVAKSHTQLSNFHFHSASPRSRKKELKGEILKFTVREFNIFCVCEGWGWGLH